VERIVEDDVWCVGLGFSCPDIKHLKEAWMQGASEDDRKKHDPYGRDGHVSLAYVQGEHRDSVAAVLESLRPSIVGLRLNLESIVVQDAAGRKETIQLSQSA